MSIWSGLIDVLQTAEFEGGVGGDKGDFGLSRQLSSLGQRLKNKTIQMPDLRQTMRENYPMRPSVVFRLDSVSNQLEQISD